MLSHWQRWVYLEFCFVCWFASLINNHVHIIPPCKSWDSCFFTHCCTFSASGYWLLLRNHVIYQIPIINDASCSYSLHIFPISRYLHCSSVIPICSSLITHQVDIGFYISFYVTRNRLLNCHLNLFSSYLRISISDIVAQVLTAFVFFDQLYCCHHCHPFSWISLFFNGFLQNLMTNLEN